MAPCFPKVGIKQTTNGADKGTSQHKERHQAIGVKQYIETLLGAISQSLYHGSSARQNCARRPICDVPYDSTTVLVSNHEGVIIVRSSCSSCDLVLKIGHVLICRIRTHQSKHVYTCNPVSRAYSGNPTSFRMITYWQTSHCGNTAR